MVRMDTHLKRLTLITNDKLALLNGGGINDMDDLGYLKYSDIQSLLIGSTTVTWRKIERVSLFIYAGETVRTVTTMADITANLRTVGVPALPPVLQPQAHTRWTLAGEHPNFTSMHSRSLMANPSITKTGSEASKRPWDRRLTLHSSRRHPGPATSSWKQGIKSSSSCSSIH